MTSDMIKYQLSIVNYQFSKCHRFLTLSVPALPILRLGSGTVSLYMQNILNGIDSAGGIEREELVI